MGEKMCKIQSPKLNMKSTCCNNNKKRKKKYSLENFRFHVFLCCISSRKKKSVYKYILHVFLHFGFRLIQAKKEKKNREKISASFKSVYLNSVVGILIYVWMCTQNMCVCARWLFFFLSLTDSSFRKIFFFTSVYLPKLTRHDKQFITHSDLKFLLNIAEICATER